MIMTKCTLYHRCSSFIGPISQLLAAAHCKWTLLSAHAHRMLFGACNTMLCPIYAFRLRTVFGALSNVALPGDLLPEDASLADPSGWPAVVGQLGRLLTVQRQQVEQLTQQLVVSSSSCKQLYTRSLFARKLPATRARSRWHWYRFIDLEPPPRTINASATVGSLDCASLRSPSLPRRR